MENANDGPMCNTKGKIMGQSNKRKCVIEGKDYIMCLPNSIIFCIFSLLSLEELVMASLVSKEWENLVRSYLSSKKPLTLHLNELKMASSNILANANILQSLSIQSPFIYQLCLRYSVNVGYKRFTQYVNRTLYLHTGCNIKKLRFKLCFDGFRNSQENVDRWFHFALTNEVKKLEINFSKGMLMGYNDFSRAYELPHIQYVSKSLKRLKLNFCKVGISSFAAFGFLKRLFLKCVIVFDFTIEDLMTKCPMLKKLRFECCTIPLNFMICKKNVMIRSLEMIDCYTQNWPICPIEISAPELRMLTLEECYLTTETNITAPKLVHVDIAINELYTDSAQREALVKLLGNCSNHCQKLSLNSWCIQVLSYGEYFLQQSPILFNNVTHLKLQVGFRKEELPGIAYIMRSCRYMESLVLHIKDSTGLHWGDLEGEIPIVFDLDVDHYWQSQVSPFRWLQYYLKKVEIYGICGKSQEIRMLQFILENAKVLENISLFIPKEISNKAILQQLSTFQKASPQAIISTI